MRKSISDLAIVLSRTDYGEKDRILTVLTPAHGKLRAIAKSVRSGKSRLAGGIELFAVNELSFIEGRGDLYTITFSRMKKHFGDIAQDLEKSMYAYECMKSLNKNTPDGEGGEYFAYLASLLEALSKDNIPFEQVKIWYSLKMLDAQGTAPNFKTDAKGNNLSEDDSFEYDFDKQCFKPAKDGTFNADHLKLLRYLQRSPKPKAVEADESITEAAGNLARLIFLNQAG